jgi:hypothetical protein
MPQLRGNEPILGLNIIEVKTRGGKNHSMNNLLQEV